MERNQALGIGLAAVVVAAAIGWVAGRQIQSPAEIAANTAPPDASLISVPVEQVTLASEVVTRGTVGYGSPVQVTPAGSELKMGSSTIVTQAPTKGAELAEGSVAYTLSGRPAFVLQGAVPASRDLTPGTQGDDVRQLQEGLTRLGFDPGRTDGVYDGRTASAVAAWYQSMDYTPFGPTDEQLSTLRAARESQSGAQSELGSAEEALATAVGNEAAAIANVDTMQAALDVAIEAERLAQAQLAAGRAEDPALPFAELSALETAANTAAGAVRTAQADLNAANAAVGPASQGVAAAQRRVAAASSRAGTAGGEVGQVAGKMGISVPADEVLFFPVVPVKVNEVTAQTGEELAGPIMTVSGSQLAVEGALTQGDQKLVREGADVRIEEPELQIRAEGTVTDVADTPGPPPADLDPSRFFLQVTPTNLSEAHVGTSVILNISVGSTGGEVLAVPVAALSVGANGKSRVQVETKDGGTRYVTVTPGLTAQGLVAVTPVDGRLEAGDLVVMGKGAGRRSNRTTVTTSAQSTTPTSSRSTSSTTATTAPAGDPRSGIAK